MINRFEGLSDQKTAEKVLPRALLLTMPILRAALTEGQGAQIKKEDDTIATAIDKHSEDTVIDYLESHLDMPIVGEEGGRVGNYTGKERVVFVDPQDGTVSGRMHSTTHTAGAAVYNPVTKEFEAGAILDPFGGRLWSTKNGEAYREQINVYTAEAMGEAALIRTSLQSGEDGGQILMDIMRGFTRKDVLTGEKREVMTNPEKWQLLDTLHQRVGAVGTAASNLHHQALLADGGAVIGSVTSALGGPWDMSGLPLVKNAGGEVAYLRREGKQFEEVDDPMIADMALAANNTKTMGRMKDSITHSLK